MLWSLMSNSQFQSFAETFIPRNREVKKHWILTQEEGHDVRNRHQSPNSTQGGVIRGLSNPQDESSTHPRRC